MSEFYDYYSDEEFNSQLVLSAHKEAKKEFEKYNSKKINKTNDSENCNKIILNNENKKKSNVKKIINK